MTTQQLPQDVRSTLRRLAGLDTRDARPIVLVSGTQGPKVRGRSYHWTTPGGQPVWHPSAYSQAFGRPVYHGSTRRVEVSRLWLVNFLRRSPSYRYLVTVEG